MLYGGASIFKCLCKEHDDHLFADIEKRVFYKEPKQCFQYALKALLHSYWSKCNDAGITEKYKQDIQIAQQIAEDQIAYKEELNCFWKIYQEERYQDVLCHVITINHEVKSAVSTSINMCRKLDGSFFGKENDNYPLLHISVILPLLAENIMISPRVVNKMTSQEKHELLMLFRIETMSFYYQKGININRWANQVSYNIWGVNCTIKLKPKSKSFLLMTFRKMQTKFKHRLRCVAR